MHVFAYLKQCKVAVVVVICLLVVQAFCDLSLPRYTSDIVDVGIQQSGVEDAATDEMTASTFDKISLMLSEKDEATLDASYDESKSGTYKLNDEGRDNRSELDKIVELPLVVVHSASSMDDFDLDKMLEAYRAGTMDKQQILDAVDKGKDQFGADDELLDQQAILAAQEEYKSLDYDLSSMQMDYLVRVGLTMLGLAGLGMAVAIIVCLIAARSGAKIGANLRGRLFRRVVSFSDTEINHFSAASLITRGTNDIQLIQMVSIMMLRMVLYAPILGIGGIIMMATTSLQMSWVIAAGVVAIGCVIVFLMAVAMPRFRIMQKLIDRVNLVSREILNGISVIRAFDRQQFEEKRFDDASTNLYKTQLFTNRVMTFMMPVMMLIMNLVSVLIVWVGGHYIDIGSIQTGDLIASITYAMVIIMGFLMIGMMAIMLPRADVAAQRINEVIGTEPVIHDPAADEEQDQKLAQQSQEEPGARIAFKDVSFRYGNSEENILSHLNFVAESGKTTALVGSTGSGKSTVLKLLERFYDVSEGSITIDGVDIRDVTQHALRAQLGYVPQKAFLFSGTIESNIAYSDDQMPHERVEQAADIAQVAQFIAGKDEGYETVVSQGGTNVSGGQRQRLAIARALATDARAYLFDDSFSALDYRTDAALRQELHTQLSGKTVIIVAQRISTVLHADNIVVLEEGRIVGQGTHEQLIDSCDEYREIALSQLSEAELGGGELA